VPPVNVVYRWRLERLGNCSWLADWSHFKSGSKERKAVDIRMLKCPTQSLYASQSKLGPLNTQVSGNMLTVIRCYLAHENIWNEKMCSNFPAKAEIQCRSYFENICAPCSWTRVQKITVLWPRMWFVFSETNFSHYRHIFVANDSSRTSVVRWTIRCVNGFLSFNPLALNTLGTGHLNC
jgi:hypothetical protein